MDQADVPLRLYVVNPKNGRILIIQTNVGRGKSLDFIRCLGHLLKENLASYSILLFLPVLF